MIIILTVVEFSLLLEIAVQFLYGYYVKSGNRMIAGYGGFMACIFVAALLQFWNRLFFDFPESERTILCTIAVGQMVFQYLTERYYGRKMNSRVPFSKISVILVILVFVVPYYEIFYQILAFILGISGFAFFAAVFRVLFRINSQVMRHQVQWSFWGTFGIFLGFAGTSDQATALISAFFPEIIIPSILVFTCIMIVGLLIVRYKLTTEIFIETGWTENLEEIFLVKADTNAILYHKYYSSGTQDTNFDHFFVIESILRISGIIQDFTKNDSALEVIEEDNRVIILERGLRDQNLVGVLFVSKYIRAFRIMLRQSISKFEEYFAEIWEKVPNKTQLLEDITKEIFEWGERK